jgi:hypothetical protein
LQCAMPHTDYHMDMIPFPSVIFYAYFRCPIKAQGCVPNQTLKPYNGDYTLTPPSSPSTMAMQDMGMEQPGLTRVTTLGSYNLLKLDMLALPSLTTCHT